jgi:hypothetical protein
MKRWKKYLLKAIVLLAVVVFLEVERFKKEWNKDVRDIEH